MCVPSATPQSPKISVPWLTPECSRMHIEPPSAPRDHLHTHFLSPSFFFHPPIFRPHSLLLQHSVTSLLSGSETWWLLYFNEHVSFSSYRGICKNEHWQSPRSFPPLLLCVRRFLLIPRQSSCFFFLFLFFNRIMPRKRRQKKVRKWESRTCKRNRWRVSCVGEWMARNGFQKLE